MVLSWYSSSFSFSPHPPAPHFFFPCPSSSPSFFKYVPSFPDSQSFLCLLLLLLLRSFGYKSQGFRGLSRRKRRLCLLSFWKQWAIVFFQTIFPATHLTPIIKDEHQWTSLFFFSFSFFFLSSLFVCPPLVYVFPCGREFSLLRALFIDLGFNAGFWALLTFFLHQENLSSEKLQLFSPAFNLCLCCYQRLRSTWHWAELGDCRLCFCTLRSLSGRLKAPLIMQSGFISQFQKCKQEHWASCTVIR